jgi:hypothetical protein
MDQISALGTIRYEFMMVVFEKGATDPLLFVTSELNDPSSDPEMLEELGMEPEDFPQGASHFLCVFDESGHHNMGDSDEWGDIGKFEAAALKLLVQRLGHRVVAR